VTWFVVDRGCGLGVGCKAHSMGVVVGVGV
jgi:hypothetical protein